MKYPCHEGAKNESFPLFFAFPRDDVQWAGKLPLKVEGKRADRRDLRIPGSLRLGRGAARWLMPASPTLLARTNVGMTVERSVHVGSGSIPLDEHSRI